MSRMQSLAEIVSGEPQAKPAYYKGIRFRSKLEARFARHLDALGEEWVYEPRIYGPRGRGYLPDFELVGTTWPTFIELKPTRKKAIAAQEKVAVIWEECPTALLIIAAEEGFTYYRAYRGGRWDAWTEKWSA